MSATPEGPGWWQASDLLWYPPQQHPAQPAAPMAAPTPHRPERTVAQSVRNAVLWVVITVVVVGGGYATVTAVNDRAERETEELRAKCSAERTRVLDALEFSLGVAGRYDDIDGLIEAGILDEKPENYTVTPLGPKGFELGYKLNESKRCTSVRQ